MSFGRSDYVNKRNLCRKTECRLSAGRFSGFCNFFCIKPNLRNLSPYGARHKNFGPTCSVASPPTNDTFSFSKKFKGGWGDKLNWGDPQKNRFLSETDRKSFYFALFFLRYSYELFRIHFCTEQNNKFWNRPKECWDIRNLVRVESNRKFCKS